MSFFAELKRRNVLHVAAQTPQDGHLYFLLAQVYAVSGEIEQAFHWLEQGERNMLAMFRPLSSRYFENLHDDPRWLGYLERAGIAPQQLAEIDFDPQVPGL